MAELQWSLLGQEWRTNTNLLVCLQITSKSTVRDAVLKANESRTSKEYINGKERNVLQSPLRQKVVQMGAFVFAWLDCVQGPEMM
jgi:hypothetical protein